MQTDLQKSKFSRNPNFLSRRERDSSSYESCPIQVSSDTMLRLHMLSQIISTQFNFTTKAYRQDHQKKPYHKINTDLPQENPKGKNPTRKASSIQMIKKIKDKTSNWSFSFLQIRLSLSLMLYTRVCLCVQMRSASALFIFFCSLDISLNQVNPTKIDGADFSRRTQNNPLLDSGGC